eukprot:5791852-Pyramimonas_sp.AAC.2
MVNSPISQPVSRSRPDDQVWTGRRLPSLRVRTGERRVACKTCVAEPTATPMAMSILFFMAKMTAEACSAALPTIGSTITEMNATGIPMLSAAPSMASTRYSDRTEIKMVIRNSQNRHPPK